MKKPLVRTYVRMPVELIEKLRRHTQENGISIQWFMARAVENELKLRGAK